MASMFKINILKPGLFTTLQDLGRIGHQDAGIPFSGAMDKEAHKIANELLDNPHSTPTIEMTLKGAEFEFEGEGQIAITGADMHAELNTKPAPMYQTIDVKYGDKLVFHQSDLGCRTYLAVKGEWTSTQWLKSFSAVSNLMNIEGVPGQLKAGNIIEIETSNFIERRTYPLALRPIYSSCYILRVVSGPEFEQFDIQQIQSFFDTTFEVSADSNRMGYRLKGNIEHYEPQGEEISSGIVEGTIQITNSGEPIILTSDAQTTGGYPRIANVVSEDLSIVAQMKAGDEVRFMLVSLSDL